MQYLVSVIDDKNNPGSTDRQPAISAFNERLIAEGYWVFAGGLADTDAAMVIDNRGEQAVFSDGPFVESKEYLAGVWVWEAPVPTRVGGDACVMVSAGGDAGWGAGFPGCPDELAAGVWIAPSR